MKSTTTAAIAALGVALSGCATIVEGTKQSVSVRTMPADGAQCTLTNSQGTWYVTTPGSVEVHKTKTDLNITCNKDGYAQGHVVAESHFKGTTAGNLVFGVVGAPVGAGVDAASGANFYYDSPIDVMLGSPTGPGSSASSSPIQLHCTPPATDGVFISEGPTGYISAKIRFSINSAGDPGAVHVTQADDAGCTLSASAEIALASVTFDIDPDGSMTAGGKPSREIEKHVDIVETTPDVNAGRKTYTFRVKAKDATEGKITLTFPVRYH